MAIHNNQIETAPKLLPAQGTAPVTGTGMGAFFSKVVASNTEAFYQDANGNSVQLTNNGVIATPPGSGEANTGANLGAGQGIFASKTGVQLNFKSLVAGTNVTLTSDANTITISATGGGGGGGTITGATNLGTGVGVFSAVAGSNLNFRSLTAGTGITLVPSGVDITINATSASYTGSNLGGGTVVFNGLSGSNFQFNTLAGGTGISLGLAGNVITISSTGVAAGVSSFNSLTGAVVLAAGSNITLTPSGNTITIASTNAGSITGATNLGAGQGVFAAVSGSNLQFKSLIAGTNITLTPTGTDITISAATGVTSFNSLSGAVVLSAGSGITLSPSGNTITITSTATSGVSSLNSLSGALTLIGSGNTTITPSGSNITISSTGITSATNITGGSGEGLFASTSGTVLQFKSLIAGSGVSIVSDGTDLTISSTNVGTITGAVNLGAGDGLYTSVSGANLQFKSLVAGSGVTLTPGSNTITITATGTAGVASLNSLSGVLNLVAGTGITVTPSGSNITIATSGTGSSLTRYNASSVTGEEAWVLADGTGITYSRSGSTGTFTVPSGVNLITASLRVPMATVGGFTFTVAFGNLGNASLGTSINTATFPTISYYNEVNGVAGYPAGNYPYSAGPYTQVTMTGLSSSGYYHFKMTW